MLCSYNVNDLMHFCRLKFKVESFLLLILSFCNTVTLPCFVKLSLQSGSFPTSWLKEDVRKFHLILSFLVFTVFFPIWHLVPWLLSIQLLVSLLVNMLLSVSYFFSHQLRVISRHPIETAVLAVHNDLIHCIDVTVLLDLDHTLLSSVLELNR